VRSETTCAVKSHFGLSLRSFAVHAREVIDEARRQCYPQAWFEAFDLHLGIITRIRTLNEKGKCSMQ
jgi:hypothetical protein